MPLTDRYLAEIELQTETEIAVFRLPASVPIPEVDQPFSVWMRIGEDERAYSGVIAKITQVRVWE